MNLDKVGEFSSEIQSLAHQLKDIQRSLENASNDDQIVDIASSLVDFDAEWNKVFHRALKGEIYDGISTKPAAEEIQPPEDEAIEESRGL